MFFIRTRTVPAQCFLSKKRASPASTLPRVGSSRKSKNFMSDDRVVRQPQEFGDAFVDRAQGAVQRYGAGGIFEGVDQFLEVALRARNHLGELVELLLGGSRAHMFLQILKQQFEFADFLPPAVSINRQKNG